MEHAVDCRSLMRFAVMLRRVTQDMGMPEQWARLDARLDSDKGLHHKKRKSRDVVGDKLTINQMQGYPSAAAVVCLSWGQRAPDWALTARLREGWRLDVLDMRLCTPDFG